MESAIEIIRIIYTEEDVRSLAEECGVPYDTAMQRAESWGRHIQNTAITLCSEQLASVIEHGQP